MNKLIYTGDQEDLVRAAGQIITFFEDVRGIKSAASNSFSDEMMRQFVPDDDHFGVHAIAMGSGEDYGFNKNGDFWTRDGLVKRCNTFVTHGHFFREHNNRDPKLKIGDVKAAAYNAPQQRVELIMHGNKRKAEREYARAKAGKSSSYSMSARVPDDECSICGKRAKRSSVYCDDLKKHMTEWMPRHQKFAYAINHEPTFFDISDVENPADRIAHHLQYIWGDQDREMAKAASAGEIFLFSDMQAKLAGVDLPEDVTLGYSETTGRLLLEKLAATEEYIEQATDRPKNFSASDLKFAFLKSAAVYGFDPTEVQDSQLEALRGVEPDILFYQMAKQAAVFPFFPFYCYVTGKTTKQASEDPVYQYASESLLHRIFRNAMAKQADVSIESLFIPASLDKAAAAGMPEPTQKVMAQVSESFSIQPKIAKSRILRICADMPDPGGCGVKGASGVTDDIKRSALTYTQAYAMYKVAFVQAAAELAGNSIIDEPSLILITYPYRS